MRIGYGALLTAAAGLIVGCTNDPIPDEAKVTATDNMVFSPMTVVIKPGGTVTFVFHDVGHTVLFDPGVSGAPEDITGTSTNIEVQRTFATLGTFNYHCTLHPGMVGRVIVAEEGTSLTE